MSNEKILFIVESPNKIATLKKFLPSNYTIMASVGHISKIKDSGVFNMGIDPNNKFKADYIISEDKKDVFKKLKDQVAKSDKVILASDPDREGELIAYMLKKFLKLKENNYERITFHEITQKAVTEALKNPRKINENLALSAMSRARLDKIVGYRLSPVARKNVSCKSVGRCQSAGLKLIVRREEEIKNFISKKYYELFFEFPDPSIMDILYKAKYIGTDDNKNSQFDDIDIITSVMNDCMNKPFEIKDVIIKDRNINPKLPFTTSTFQQEVSTKLNIPIKKAMEYAQKLFEGININGEHIALITYIRTDSTELAPEFIDELKSFILNNFGPQYYAPIKKHKQKDNVQNGHEAIRPVDLRMTPELLSKYIEDYTLLKIYSIIYNRTIASSMSPCIIQDTDYYIYNGKHKFLLSLHSLKFDGYRVVYNYKEEDEEINNLPQFPKIITNGKLKIEAKETKPPKRYTEASFINTLDKLSIGRPSTYSSILNVLLDKTRGYCNLENKIIIPTEKGIILSNFLTDSFSDIISIDYTAELESYLDLISEGKLNDVDFLTEFYLKLDESVKNVSPADASTNEICPQCGSSLVYRNGPYGPFKGCSNYPKCKFIKKVN